LAEVLGNSQEGLVNPLVVSYLIKDRKIGLSVRLGKPSGSGAERVRQLHQAAATWGKDKQATFVPEISAAPIAGSTVTDLDEYLYSDGSFNGSRLQRHLTMLLEDGCLHRFVLRPGAPVEGPDLVGRNDVLARLHAAVEAGRSCHLRAPRRYGKTSVLRRVQSDLTRQGRACLLADLSPGTSVAWLWVTLAQSALAGEATRKVVIAMPELAGWPEPGASALVISQSSHRLATAIGLNPWSFGQRLFAQLASQQAVLMLDEFSVFLRTSMQKGSQDVGELARLMQESRKAPSGNRQLLSGSAGLAKYLAFNNLGPRFDDLEAVELSPFSAPECRVLAEELLYGAGIVPDPRVVAKLAELGGPVPYFIHLLTDAVLMDVHVGVLSAESVERAYRERVLGPWANASFKAFSLASQSYPEDLRRVAMDLLRMMARTAEGAPEFELRRRFEQENAKTVCFESLLACLQEDFDLVDEDSCWRMRCRPLRDRWALAEAWLTEGSS
jgi:hypothetical protein